MVLLWKIHGSVVMYILMIAIRVRGDNRKGASGEGKGGGGWRGPYDIWISFAFCPLVVIFCLALSDFVGPESDTLLRHTLLYAIVLGMTYCALLFSSRGWSFV